MSSTNYIVGISGGSGAGKTEFLKRIQSQFGEDKICVVSQDNYYFPRAQQVLDEEGYINFDRPEAIDHLQLADHIISLRQDQSVELREYLFNSANPTESWVKLKPAPIIIVEGIFVFHYTEVSKLFDLRLFIDSDPKLMLTRRLDRDQKERGYDKVEVNHRFNKHMLPAFENYILPYKSQAHYVIKNNVDFEGLNSVISILMEKMHN